MNRLHQIFWRVKGRMPAAVSVEFLLAVTSLWALSELVPREVGRTALLVLAAPLAYALMMVYSYFAIALPLLGLAYLGGCYPEQYRALVGWAIPATGVGILALLLGVLSESMHWREKKLEIRRRYGAEIPWPALLPLGFLGLYGGTRDWQRGDGLDARGIVFVLFGSAISVLAGTALWWSWIAAWFRARRR